MATANPKQPAALAAKTEPVKGLRIVARSEGFRRAGRAFGTQPVEIALSDLTEAHIKALRAERELVVVDCEIQVQAPSDEAPAE